MDFSKRHREDELMDDPAISLEALKPTYEDINRANQLLGGHQGILDALLELIGENRKKSYSIIDVGCGDGSTLRRVGYFFKRKGIDVRLTGIDLNTKAVALARESSENYPEIDYHVGDVLNKESMENLEADFVISILTLHHIAEDDIPLFLGQLAKMARIGIIINDLQRSRAAYYLFKWFSAIFIKTKIAKNDGLISIRSGFTKKELLQYSERLTGLHHSIRSHWAFRYVWVMKVKRPIVYEQS